MAKGEDGGGVVNEGKGEREAVVIVEGVDGKGTKAYRPKGD